MSTLTSNKETFKGFFRKIFKRKDLEEMNQLEIIVLAKNRNYHETFRFKNGVFPEKGFFTFGEKTFDFNIQALFRDSAWNPFKTFYRKIEKISNKYTVIYQAETGKPVLLRESGKINGHVLFVAAYSTTWSRSLAEFLGTSLGSKAKWLLFAGIIIAVIVGIVLVYPQLTRHAVETAVNNGGLSTPIPIPTP